jgi:hypothetical protein
MPIYIGLCLKTSSLVIENQELFDNFLHLERKSPGEPINYEQFLRGQEYAFARGESNFHTDGLSCICHVCFAPGKG